MRKINKIVLHHSATTSQNNFEKLLKSFDNNHKKRLTEKYNQEKSWTKYENIAYHYVISKNWEITETRKSEKVWFHASNLRVNNESIGICFVWNFDLKSPTQKQYEAWKKIIETLRKKFWHLTIHKHSEFANKTCPWKNFKTSKLVMWEYENLFKNWENKWKSEVLQDVEWWIQKAKIERELAFSLLIMFNRIKKWNMQK